MATQHIITFNSQGGTTEANPTTIAVDAGTALPAFPAPPTKTGYVFAGWYLNTACTNLYYASTLVTAPFTVYAKWTPATYLYQGTPLDSLLEPRTYSLKNSSGILTTVDAIQALNGSRFLGAPQNGFAQYSPSFIEQQRSSISDLFLVQGVPANITTKGYRPRHLRLALWLTSSSTVTYYIGRNDSTLTIYDTSGSAVASINCDQMALSQMPHTFLVLMAGGGGGGGGASGSVAGGGGGGAGYGWTFISVPDASGTNGRKIIIGGSGGGGHGGQFSDNDDGGHGGDTYCYFDNNSTNYAVAGGGEGGHAAHSSGWGGGPGYFSLVGQVQGAGGRGGYGGNSPSNSASFIFTFSQEQAIYELGASHGDGGIGGGGSQGAGGDQDYNAKGPGGGGGGGTNHWFNGNGGHTGGQGLIALFY